MGKQPARITVETGRDGVTVTLSNRNSRGVHYRSRFVRTGKANMNRAERRSAVMEAFEILLPNQTKSG